MEKNIEQFIYEEIIKGKGEVTFDYLGKKSIMKAMESYAQYKVNELNKSDVIKSVCDKHDWQLIAPNSSRCRKCGAVQKCKQTVL